MGHLTRQIQALEHQHVFVFDPSHGQSHLLGSKHHSTLARDGLSQLPSSRIDAASSLAARARLDLTQSLTAVNPAKKTQPW